jgi:hyperosmotically inducible periplasmic protein
MGDGGISVRKIPTKKEIMKKVSAYWNSNARRLAMLLCVGVTPILAGGLMAGCAGDRYHESTGETIDDTSTTARVKSALGGDPQYKYDDVHVTTFKGDVQLSGFVNTGDAKSRAGTLAKNVEGVKEVENNISVKE